MMRSSNPVLSRSDAWTPSGYAPADQQHGQQPAGGGPMGAAPRDQGLMTLDDVITKTAVLLGIVALTAGATYYLLPQQMWFPAAVVGGIGSFIVTLIVATRRVVPVPLTFVFAVLEGLLVGAISGVFEGVYPGIVVQAVFATMVAAAVTLFVYRVFNIRIGNTFRKVVTISTFAIAAVMLINFIAFLITGSGIGIRAGVTGEVGLLPYLFSAVAVVLAVLNLVMDFDHVERGIEMRAPANQSWRAAFGLTVTLVWLYIELLRIISYFRR